MPIFFLWHWWLLSDLQFCDFSLNKSYKTHERPMLLPDDRLWQVTYPNYDNNQQTNQLETTKCESLTANFRVGWRFFQLAFYSIGQLTKSLWHWTKILTSTNKTNLPESFKRRLIMIHLQSEDNSRRKFRSLTYKTFYTFPIYAEPK